MTRSGTWAATKADFATFLGLLGFAVEVPFRGLSGKRRFAFDWARSDLRIAVEYQGKGPGHMSVRGAYRDHEKTTEAQLCGWLLIQCNAKTIENGQCQTWVETALAVRDCKKGRK